MLTLNQRLLDDICAIAQAAGEHLKAFYARSVEISIKSDKTPVTEADLFSSQFVIEQLQQLTPDIPILSEESCNIPLEQRQHWQEYWLIDPLDGTQQFIDRTDQFSVVIALVQNNCPVLGVIHAPVLGKTYLAMRNHGAVLLEQGERKVLGEHCKFLGKNDRLRVTVGSGKRQKIIDSIAAPYQPDFLQYGSSSLKAGLVAEGKADCYVRLGDTGEWDTAAAEVLLTEVNGCVFDLKFQSLSYNQRPIFVNPHFVMVADKDANWNKIFQFNLL